MFEFNPIFIVLFLGVILGTIVAIVGMWKTFEKAGKPGWAALIPIYSVIVLLEIVGRPISWFFLMLIPIVNIVLAFIVSVDMAKSFGKDVGFGAGIFFIPYVMYPILGFGDAEYGGPSVEV